MAIESGAGTDICVTVGRRIAQLRTLAGIERSHLARLELGEREAGLRMLEKIADAFGVATRDLL
jgi:transcriptional regulator with XRE-family HTH domain